jgi:serine/threonine protein kinase
MEYFPNLSVEDYVTKVGYLYYRTSRNFAIQMANAVAYLHGRKPHHFIHRDIKPSVSVS